MDDKIIFHVDVNSAYLSWIAVHRLQFGEDNIDIRTIPSIIGGNIKERHGIVLAKSIPAKKYNIQTGEPVVKALGRCKDLKVYPPDYKIFMRCSDAMYELLREYSPLIQRYSVDEVFMDMSHLKDNYMDKAIEIKDRIEKELGFTVNIGISTNKLLAKMASDFKKKNSIYTLFQEEIKDKMWPLPIRDLFMVGSRTEKKLKKLNIQTIGDLAHYNFDILNHMFKSYAKVIYNYANGIENSKVRDKNYLEVKGIGNSTTVPFDIFKREDALKVLLSLVETASMRLRKNETMCTLVHVSIKTNVFIRYSHQVTLNSPTDSTEELFKEITKAFDEVWKGEGIRHLGVRFSKLWSNEFYQKNLFDDDKKDKRRALDKAIDEIRFRYGNKSVFRSTFINSEIKPLSGGVLEEEDYMMMGSIL